MWTRPWCSHLQESLFFLNRKFHLLGCMHLNTHCTFIDFFFWVFFAFFAPLWAFYRCVIIVNNHKIHDLNVVFKWRCMDFTHLLIVVVWESWPFNDTNFLKLSPISTHLGMSLNTNEQLTKMKLACFRCFNLQNYNAFYKVISKKLLDSFNATTNL
jgi:hypothetical protein